MVFLFRNRAYVFCPWLRKELREETCVHFCRLRMNCLAEFVGNSEVWVLGRATVSAQPSFVPIY